MSNRSHKRELGYVISVWMALGCGAEQHATQRPHAAEAEIATSHSPARTVSDTPNESAAAHPSAPPEPSAQANPSSEGTDRKRALVQPLPTDPSFAERPLAAVAPERFQSFREHSRIGVGKSHLQEFDVSADERLLYVSSGAESSVRVYERKSKRLLANIAVTGLAPFDDRTLLSWPSHGPDAEPLFIVGTKHGMDLISARTKDTRSRLGTGPVHSLRWSPDQSILIATASDVTTQTSVLTFYRRNGLELETIAVQPFAERVDGCALSADNRLLALTHYPSGDVRVIDLVTQQDIVRTPGPQFNGDVALSPDGRYLAVGGAGLLVIDLLNASRRAFYSFTKNNIGFVRFSPNGDALAASSFDGRIRIFALHDRAPTSAAEAPQTSPNLPTPLLELSLLTMLRHEGQANVYGFVFTSDGALISASGDQTLREFRGKPRNNDAGARGDGRVRRFRTLEQWRKDEPEHAVAWPSPPEPPMLNGHYAPPALTGPALPSRLRVGAYECKISQLYKLRGCRVWRDGSGRTLLSFEKGNLLRLDAVVFDAGPVIRFEAWQQEESMLIDCPGCKRQPMHGLLRGTGNTLKGLLTFRNYYDPYVLPPAPPADVKVEEALDRFPIELHYRGPLEPSRSEASP